MREIMTLNEMIVYIGNLEKENERLKTKCDNQANILKHMFPERYSKTYFICGQIGSTDENGLPDKIIVCPAYGSDITEIYEIKK